MKKGKLIIGMLLATMLAVAPAISVGAATSIETAGMPVVHEYIQPELDHVIPSADPDFEEISLNDFVEANPAYEGVPDPREATGARAVESGYITTNYSGPFEWVQEGSTWYLYSGSQRATLGGWYKDGGYWYFIYKAGSTKNNGATAIGGEMVVGWEKIGGDWYYFNAYGQMATSWRYIDGVYYYFSLAEGQAGAVSGCWEGEMITGAHYLPIASGSSNYRNYYFDANGAMQDWHYPLPTNYLTLSSCFNDPRSGGNHQGIDVPASYGTTITSASSGKVYQAGADLDTENGMGYYSKVNTGILGHRSRNLVAIYMHMAELSPVAVGGNVVKGSTVIGRVASTGASTGNHLHFQITYKGDMGTTSLANSLNPAAFFSETLIPNSGCDVPAYGREYNYYTGEFEE